MGDKRAAPSVSDPSAGPEPLRLDEAIGTVGNSPDEEQIINEFVVAELLNVKVGIVRGMRRRGVGPRWFRVGGKAPRYTVASVKQYIAQLTDQSQKIAGVANEGAVGDRADELEETVEPALTEDETATILRVSLRVLARMRRKGEGPRYVICGGFVRYPAQCVREFLASANSSAASG
jgi:hypothetical protein